MIKLLIIIPITIYQKTLSVVFPSSCRFSPSCSQYMIDSINKSGVLIGFLNGLKRIIKCHPFSKFNGWDPA